MQMALGPMSDMEAAESMSAVVLFLCDGSVQPGDVAKIVVVRLFAT